MEQIIHSIAGKTLVEYVSNTKIISSIEEGIDLVGTAYFSGFDGVILHKTNIISQFFDLKNGMAGEILQKFSTYNIRLFIIGDFLNSDSKSLNDFILESNKGKHVNFLDTIAQISCQN